MSGTVSLTAKLIAAPQSGGNSNFPSGVVNIDVALNPPDKPYNVDAGNVLTLNSPSALVAIPGIGGSVGPVTQGTLLFLRTTSPMQIQKTYTASPSDIVVGPEPFSGLHVIECDPAHPLKLLELQGAGTVEFWCGGVQ